MADEKTKYNRPKFAPFDGYEGAEHEFEVKTTSMRNVRELAFVIAHSTATDDQTRAKWAAIGNMKPTKHIEQEIDGVKKKFPVYTLSDIYPEGVYHAALAQELFLGFPEIVRVQKKEDDYEVKVLNEELFLALDQGAVNQAFLYWNKLRNGILSPQKAF